MFGTMGFSELMIILVIILIIFGAGRLPQIGEGVGKALKGFKKEVADIPPPVDPNEPHTQHADQNQYRLSLNRLPRWALRQISHSSLVLNKPREPLQRYFTREQDLRWSTLHLNLQGLPVLLKPRQLLLPPHRCRWRIGKLNQPPWLPGNIPLSRSGAQAKPVLKRPAAVVNKQAVARVQAQQAAMKAQASQQSGLAPRDMQSLGEGLGSAVRTFRDAAADIKNSIDPQMRTIQAELESAEKEMQDSIEVAKEPLNPKEPSGSA